MLIELATLNWWAILVCVVMGQALLTVWFAVLVAEPWAKVYGASNKSQHAAEIPMYTYGVGLLCMVFLTIGLAILRAVMNARGVSGGLFMGLFVSLTICLATVVPGYAFLRRWTALFLAIVPQIFVIVAISVVLAMWD